MEHISHEILLLLESSGKSQTISEIAKMLNHGRQSTARHLDILLHCGKVSMIQHGMKKKYYIPKIKSERAIENFSDHIQIILNKEISVVQINDAFLHWIGKTKESIVGKKLGTLLNNIIDGEILYKKILSLSEGHSCQFEEIIRIKEKQYIFEFTLSRFSLRKNDPYIFLSGENITTRKNLEIALLNREEKLRTLTQNIPGVVFRLDLEQQKYEYCSWFYEIIGYHPDVITSYTYHPLEQYVHPDDFEHVQKEIMNIVKSGKKYELEYRIIAPNNTILHLIERGKPVYDISGQVRYLDGIIFDISKRILAEEKIKEKNELLISLNNELIAADRQLRDTNDELLRIQQELMKRTEQFQLLVENISDIVWIIDPETRHFTNISPSVKKLYGVPAEEILHNPIDNYLTPDGSDYVRKVLPERISIYLKSNGKQNRYRDEFRIKCKDGSLIWTEIITNIYTNQKTRKIEIVGVSRDISQRKTLELQNVVQKQIIKQSQKIGHIGSFEYTLNSSFIWGSDEYFCIFGIVPPLNGLCPFDTIKDCFPDYEGFLYPFLKIIHENIPCSKIFTIHPADGSPSKMINIIANRIDDETRESVKISGIIQDITECKLSEERYEKSEEKYQRLFTTVEQGILYRDLRGNIISANPASTRILGLSYNQILGRDPLNPGWKSIHPDGSPYNLKTYPVLVSLYTGKEIRNELIGVMIPDSEECRWINVDTYLHNPSGSTDSGYIISVFSDVTTIKNAQEKIRETSEYLEKLISHANAPILVWNTSLIITRCNQAFCRLLGIPLEKIVGQHIEILLPPESREKTLTLLNLEYFGEEGKSVELPVLHWSGQIYTVLWSMANIFDKNGSIVATIAQGQDITDRIRTEEAALQLNRQLHLMTSITRHDILNKISALDLTIGLLKNRIGTLDNYREIGEMETIVEKIQSDIEFTRLYQQLGSQRPYWQNLEKICVDLSVPNHILYSFSVKSFEIFADGLLNKVFQNLIDNSIRHGKNVTKIHISGECQNNGLLLYYSDNGIGIPLSDKKSIFEKGVGKNSGFGLFFSREVLLITDISITEKGNDGFGVLFEITVPNDKWRFLTSDKD